jgi:hypothetical protein
MGAVAVARAKALDRRLRGPVPRPPFGGRFFWPGLLIVFGNGVAAAAIFGGALHAKSPGRAWLEAVAAEAAAVAIVTALPKRIFLVRVRRITLNFAMPVPLIGAYIAGPVFGVPAAIGFVFAGMAAVMYWTAHPRSVRHLVQRLKREGC